MTISDLKIIRKRGQIIKAAQEVVTKAKDLCPGSLPYISATSIDGTAPDDVDILMDIFNVPSADVKIMRNGLREITSPYLFQEGLVITVILHNPEDTEKYYSEEVKRIRSAPEAMRWLAEYYDDFLKRAV